MAKKQNYGFDKRRKEQDRKAKKDAKIAERRQRRAQADGDPSLTESSEPDTPLAPGEESTEPSRE